MLSNQQLYLVNHFALVARRHGLHLPDLKALLQDEGRLRAHVEAAMAGGAGPEVRKAATQLSAAFSWTLTPLGPALGSKTSLPGGTVADVAPGPMTPEERTRARAALLAVAGPIADFIAEQIGQSPGLSLQQFIEQAADLAQLSQERRRALRAACGLLN